MIECNAKRLVAYRDRYGRGEAVVNYPLTGEHVAEDQAFLRAYSAEHPDNRFIQAVLVLIRMHDLRLNP